MMQREYEKHVVLWDRTHKFYKLVNKKKWRVVGNF